MSSTRENLTGFGEELVEERENFRMSQKIY
jgi:hypothetical protein